MIRACTLVPRQAAPVRFCGLSPAQQSYENQLLLTQDRRWILHGQRGHIMETLKFAVLNHCIVDTLLNSQVNKMQMALFRLTVFMDHSYLLRSFNCIWWNYFICTEEIRLQSVAGEMI